MRIIQPTQQLLSYKIVHRLKRTSEGYFSYIVWKPITIHSYYLFNILGASLDFNSPSYGEGLF